MFIGKQSTNILDRRNTGKDQRVRDFKASIDAAQTADSKGRQAYARTTNQPGNPFGKMLSGMDRSQAVRGYAEKKAIGLGIGNLKDRVKQRQRTNGRGQLRPGQMDDE